MEWKGKKSQLSKHEVTRILSVSTRQLLSWKGLSDEGRQSFHNEEGEGLPYLRLTGPPMRKRKKRMAPRGARHREKMSLVYICEKKKGVSTYFFGKISLGVATTASSKGKREKRGCRTVPCRRKEKGGELGGSSKNSRSTIQ